MAPEPIPQTTESFKREVPTAERVRDALDYDPATGVFVWRERELSSFATVRSGRVWNTKYAGKVAGSLDSGGYSKISIDAKDYRAHRLAWLYATGAWPAEQIDHRDGDTSNNRFDNLREATNAENGCNRCAYTNNSSGVKGVCWNGQRKKWMAQIQVDGCKIYLGLFTNLNDAAAAYAIAAQEHHGRFARPA